MANLDAVRRRLTIVVAVLLGVCVVCIGILLSPLSSQSTARDQEFRDVRAKVQQKMRVVIPPSQVDQRVQEARQQIAAFYKDRLPSESSAITEELGTLATKDGIFLSTAHYDTKDTNVPDAQQVSITANLSGPYEKVVQFINDLERDRMLFIVDSVNLVEQSGGKVRLAVQFETYLRSGS